MQKSRQAVLAVLSGTVLLASCGPSATPVRSALDPAIADAVALSGCSRKATLTTCYLTSKAPVRMSLYPLESVCYVGNTQVEQWPLSGDIDPKARVLLDNVCLKDNVELVVVRQRKSY